MVRSMFFYCWAKVQLKNYWRVLYNDLNDLYPRSSMIFFVQRLQRDEHYDIIVYNTVCNNINLLLIIILINITITIITILIIITSSNNDDNNNNNTNNHNNNDDNNILYNEYLHLHTNMYIVIILWLGIDEIVLGLSTRQSVSQSSESVGTNGRICKPFNLRL